MNTQQKKITIKKNLIEINLNNSKLIKTEKKMMTQQKKK